MNKYCRTCAKEAKKLTPFWSNRGRRKNSTVVEDLNFILLGRNSIEDQPEDALPKSICHECTKRLNVAVNFLKECLEAQTKLQKMSSKTSTQERKTRKKVKKKEILDPEENVEPLEADTLHSSDDDQQPPPEQPEQPKKEEPPKVIKVPSETLKNDKNFQCSFCQRILGNKFRLKNHMRIHTGERPFVCKICNKAFAQPNALKCHIRLHTGEKPYKCPIESCGKTFTQNTTLKTHMTALHIGKSVKCDSCEKTFTRISYLTAHQRLEHFGERPYACHLCPKRYKQKSHLDHHLEVHQGVKYVCNVCNRSYSKKWSLQVHSYTHMKNPEQKLPHPCTECEESFARKDKLRAHVKAKHAEGVKKVEEVPVPSNVVEVESRPIILEQSSLEELKEFDGRQYHVINITDGTELIQEIVIPNATIFY